MAYQGHKTRAHWNVSLWINNDEALYKAAMNIARLYPKDKHAAARHMLGWCKDVGMPKTPDGYAFTEDTIYQAMKEMT